MEEVDRAEFSRICASPDCYHYQLTGQDYAFLRADVDRRLNDVEDNLFLIVRDLNTLKELKSHYDRRMHSIYVWMSYDRLRTELLDAVEEDQLNRHLQRHTEARLDFSKERRWYDHVLLNEGNSDDLYRQLDGIIRLCAGGN